MAAAQPDYTQMLRPELYSLCLERGFQGVARRTKRELASLLESADRELADLRWVRRAKRAKIAEQEKQQMMVAEVADLQMADAIASKQRPTIAAHILKALMHGFPSYPILTATLFATICKQKVGSTICKQKVESMRATVETVTPAKPIEYFLEEHQIYQLQTQAHPTFTVYPFIPLNEASGPCYKRYD